MRILSLITAGVCFAGALMAQPVDKYSAARTASVTSGAASGVAMWIYSDKYTYLANEQATLKWTVKTNNDLYPYTVFLYSQNNQTGEKRYFPGNTATPTDIAGKTAAQGFEARKLSDVTKQTLLGAGGIAGTWTAPADYGMHTFVLELRDYNGGRIIKTGYMKIGVVREARTIDAATANPITQSRTLTNDIAWTIRGLLYVKNNAVLTIEPGTFIFGEGIQGGTAFIITREATIEAHGTAARPIVMTSSRPFGQRQRGDWAGLIMLGRARINVAAGAANNNPPGEFYIEGLNTNPDAFYGGQDDTHYCGTTTYVRVEFAGFELTPGNELNAFTWGACGTKTVAHHLQSTYGRDDAFEWFGGTSNASYLVGGLAADDYIDWQLGYRGKIQYGIMYQSPASLNGNGNRGIEADNSEYDRLAPLFSDPTIANITFIGSGETGFDEAANSHGIFLRRGTRGKIYNTVVTRFRAGGVHVDDDQTGAQGTSGDITLNGILLWNNNTASQTVNTVAGNTNSPRGLTLVNGPTSSNLLAEDPKLARPFEYSDPDFSGMFSSPIFRSGWVQLPDTPGIDQTARFLGGIGDVNWTEGWTMFVLDGDMAP